MDWDLWGPSYGQVVPESSYPMRPGWQCDFYFGYELDVIEEDVLNEKSCLQVLRVLIAKADIEIEELEKDLVILQSELAWVENKEWSEICSTSLREKINGLDISIQSLRNENEHEINVHVLLHREPAERIHEIVKVLLKKYCLEKDQQEQHLVDIVKHFSSDVLEYATDLSDEKKKQSDLNSDTLNSSLKLHETKANCTETLESDQAANIIIKNSSTDTSNQETCHSNENKKSGSSGLLITEEEEHCCTSTADIVILESSLKPKGNRKELEEKVKPSNTIVKDSCLDALESSANASEKEKQSKCHTKHDSTHTDDNKILISSLISGGKRKSSQKTVKLANAIPEDCNSDAIRCLIGLNGKKKLGLSISRSDASMQTKSGVADVKPKLSNLDLKTMQEKTVKGSKVAASNKIYSSKLSSKADRKKIYTSCTEKVQEGGTITVTEHPTVNSLSELEDSIGKDMTKLHPEEEGKPQAEKKLKAKTAANGQESILQLSWKPPKPKAKRKIQSNELSIREPGLPPTEGSLNSSSASKAKRRKFGISKDNASLKQSLDVTILKSVVLRDNCEGDERGCTPDMSENSVALSQKKSKKCLKLPILMEIEDSTMHNKLPKLHVDPTDGASKEDLLIINPCSMDDSHGGTTKSLPCPTRRSVNLGKLTLVDLRAIAKQHNMTKYYKLRKDALVQQIANQLG